jgi:hypothetical protein
MNYRRFLSGAALLAVLAVGAITLNSPEVEAQGPGGVPVRIQDPLPVPVTGTVNVRDVGPQTPFQAVLITGLTSITVPHDRRLTIEFVSGVCSNSGAATSGVAVGMFTRVGGNPVQHFLGAKFVLTTLSNIYVMSESVRFYADAGTQIDAQTTAGYSCDIAVSGFLSSV